MDALFSIVPLIVFFPLLGVLINAFFGRSFMTDEDSIGPGVFASLMAGLSLVVNVGMRKVEGLPHELTGA